MFVSVCLIWVFLFCFRFLIRVSAIARSGSVISAAAVTAVTATLNWLNTTQCSTIRFGLARKLTTFYPMCRLYRGRQMSVLSVQRQLLVVLKTVKVWNYQRRSRPSQPDFQNVQCQMPMQYIDVTNANQDLWLLVAFVRMFAWCIGFKSEIAQMSCTDFLISTRHLSILVSVMTVRTVNV